MVLLARNPIFQQGLIADKAYSTSLSYADLSSCSLYLRELEKIVEGRTYCTYPSNPTDLCAHIHLEGSMCSLIRNAVFVHVAGNPPLPRIVFDKWFVDQLQLLEDELVAISNRWLLHNQNLADLRRLTFPPKRVADGI